VIRRKTCKTNRSKPRAVVRKPGMCIHIPEITHAYFDSLVATCKTTININQQEIALNNRNDRVEISSLTLFEIVSS
jgi:hypothetical protein